MTKNPTSKVQKYFCRKVFNQKEISQQPATRL